MSLRSRLLLGYAVLVLLLVLAAGGGAVGFRQVSVEARGRLEIDVAAADRAERLLQALDDHHNAAIESALAPEDPMLRSAVGDHAGTVRLALVQITSASSSDVAEFLEPPIEAYILGSAAALDERAATGTDGFLRAVKTIAADARAAAARQFSSNQDRLVSSSQRVSAIARRYAVLLGALATVGLVAMVFLAHGLRRHVLERLAALHAFSMAIDAGQDSLRVTVDRTDELSRVAAGMNRMLDRRQELQQSMHGRLAQRRDTLLGLLGHVSPGSILVTPSGALVAALDPEIDVADYESLTETVRALRSASEQQGEWRDQRGRGHKVTRLTCNGRDVGWLIAPHGSESDGLVASPE